MIFKILKGVKQTAPNAYWMDFFICISNLGSDTEQHICIVSSFITALFSVKNWSVSIFPIAIRDHSMLCNLALHTKATTFHRVDCKEKSNLKRILYRSESPINRPLRNTRITFAFCFGYLSIDVEEMSSYSKTKQETITQYRTFVVSIFRIHQAVVFFVCLFFCFILFLSIASDRELFR